MYPTMKRLLAFYASHTNGTDGLLHPWDSSQWDFLGEAAAYLPRMAALRDRRA